MKYVTGIHALNLNCELETCGDWHQSALRWEKVSFADTKNMFFKDYGLEYNKTIPNHDELYITANHIRALLDLLELGKFSVAQGMNNDFICNCKYDKEVFKKVYSMRTLPNWREIDKFMGKEYKLKWLKYKEMIKCRTGKNNTKK